MIPDMKYDTVIFYTTVDREQSNPGSEKASPPYLLLNLSMIILNCVEELFIGDIKSQDLIMCTTPRIPYVVTYATLQTTVFGASPLTILSRSIGKTGDIY